MNRAVIGCLLFAGGEVLGRLGPENLCVQVLYEIDGTTVFREPLDVIAALLLGEPGTEVTRASSAIRLLPPLDAICVLGRQVRLTFLRGTRIFVQVSLRRAEDFKQAPPLP